MKIQEDANKVLKFMYIQYVDYNKFIGAEELLDHFHWDGHRIDRAVKYLRDKRYIDIILLLGNQKGLQNFILKKITSYGIEYIENELY